MLYCFIFSKFLKLYAKKKNVHSSKEFTPLFAGSEPSRTCYMVPCVYKVF